MFFIKNGNIVSIKEFNQIVRDAAPGDLMEEDLEFAIEFYRYQGRLEKRFVGECMQLASSFKSHRLHLAKTCPK